jgi:hypothetical protein
MDSFEVKTDSTPIRVEYGLVVKDPYTEGLWFAKTDTKDALAQKVIGITEAVQTQTGRRVKTIHSDGGSEFVNSTVKNFCMKNGTEQRISPASMPQLNGVAERSVRELREGERVLLEHSGLPMRFWKYAAEHYVYLWNRIKKGKTGVTPFEAIKGRKPSAKHLGVFGADVWVSTREKTQTFDAKMERGVYLGHDRVYNCSIVLLMKTSKIARTKDVRLPKQTSFEHAAALRRGQEKMKAIDTVPAPFVEFDEELLEAASIDGTMTQPLPKETWDSTTSGGVSESSEVGKPNADGTYDVERIVDKRGIGGKIKYLVQWKGFPNELTWETNQSLWNARQAIKAYEEGTDSTDDEREAQEEKKDEAIQVNELRGGTDRMLTRSGAQRMRQEENRVELADSEKGSEPMVHMVMSCVTGADSENAKENKSSNNWN